MKPTVLAFLCALIFFVLPAPVKSQDRIVIIRHAEKQEQNENLNCQGLNRSLKLINVLYKKIGIPVSIYVPPLGNGNKTLHSRMFQTITPFAVRYNVSINSSYDENDFERIAKEIKHQKGTVLLVWNHSQIPALAKALGVKHQKLKWNASDFDSMWIITGTGKNKVLKIDREGILPGVNCPIF
ncbi:histidine phosphatase family protein [Pedobacter sp. PAMC26386]|nr:histidine phosphatase family protein [Pedobacter sp. PAMC26386]